jgi:carboxypeptidase Q
MNKVKRLTLFMALVTFTLAGTGDNEPIHWGVIQEIMEEGFNNSHIMADVGTMTDVFGHRLAKSSSYLAAAKWAKKKFEEYGLENVQLDPYEFGIGWELEYTSVNMISPQYMPIIAYPQAWSSPTEGKVRGPAVFINFEEITSIQDLNQYKGKLRDAIISAPKRVLLPSFKPDAVLLSKERLDEMAQISVIPEPHDRKSRYAQTNGLPRQKIIEFMLSEGIAAIATLDQVYDDGTVMVTLVSRNAWKKGAPKQPTSFVLAAEHYNRIIRILEKGIPVEMEVELRATYNDKNLTDYNVIAELIGSDLADEVVMIGAHLDAHIAGTGAEDNATGAAQVMEAARILKAIGVKPRRTIRFALWGGEETGHAGSRAYVAKHYFNHDTEETLPEHEKFSGYFNLDYGTGKIRGIYLMGNMHAMPIMAEWMKPFHNLGMTHAVLVPGEDIGSDHVQFETVGLPVFPFLQDPVENDSVSFHSNMDVFDRIIPEYLIQGAVIVAGFVYHAAKRDELLPRK